MNVHWDSGFKRIVIVLSSLIAIVGLFFTAIANNQRLFFLGTFIGLAGIPWLLLYAVRWVVRGFVMEPVSKIDSHSDGPPIADKAMDTVPITREDDSSPSTEAACFNPVSWKSKRLLIIGTLISALSFGIGLILERREGAVVTTLQSRCWAEAAKYRRENSKVDDFEMDCDPKSLKALDDRERDSYERALGTSSVVEYKPSPGAQGEMVTAQRRLEAYWIWPKRISMLILFLFGLPWAWYFILERIRELRQAFNAR